MAVSAGTSCLFAAAESTESGAVGFFVGIATAVAANILYGWIKARNQKKILIRALLVDCVATLNKLTAVLDDLKDGAGKDTSKLSVDIQDVRDLISGVYVSPPMENGRRLIALLEPDDGRELVHYFDRWSLFFTLEARYSAVYEKLLTLTTSDEFGPNHQVTKEYWDQAIHLLRFLCRTGNELCIFACSNFRRQAPAGELSLPDLSDERWATWREFQQEQQSYQSNVAEEANPHA